MDCYVDVVLSPLFQECMGWVGGGWCASRDQDDEFCRDPLRKLSMFNVLTEVFVAKHDVARVECTPNYE